MATPSELVAAAHEALLAKLRAIDAKYAKGPTGLSPDPDARQAAWDAAHQQERAMLLATDPAATNGYVATAAPGGITPAMAAQYPGITAYQVNDKGIINPDTVPEGALGYNPITGQIAFRQKQTPDGGGGFFGGIVDLGSEMLSDVGPVLAAAGLGYGLSAAGLGTATAGATSSAGAGSGSVWDGASSFFNTGTTAGAASGGSVYSASELADARAMLMADQGMSLSQAGDYLASSLGTDAATIQSTIQAGGSLTAGANTFGTGGTLASQVSGGSTGLAPTIDASKAAGTITPSTIGSTTSAGLDLARAVGSTLSSSGGIGTSTLGNLAGALYGASVAGNQASDTKNLANSVLNADPYRNYIQNSVVPFMQNQQGVATGLQGSASGLLDQSKNLLATNPLGGDYANYQNKLATSYSDPLSIYNSPEMKALSDVFNQGIERRDSAAGRNSQYGARAVEEQNNFLTNTLPNYRTGLTSAISTSGSNQNQAYSTQAGGLENLYSTTSTAANNAARTAIPGATGTATVDQYGNLMNTANGIGNAQYSGLVGSTVSALSKLF